MNLIKDSCDFETHFKIWLSSVIIIFVCCFAGDIGQPQFFEIVHAVALNVMNNVFYFNLKARFVIKIFTLLSRLLCSK